MLRVDHTIVKLDIRGEVEHISLALSGGITGIDCPLSFPT